MVFFVMCSGVGAGVALLWDLHGEVIKRKHPEVCQDLQYCTQSIYFYQDPFWTRSELL